MSKLLMPFCYFPTTVALLDTDSTLTQSLAEALLKKNILSQTFNDLHDALETLHQTAELNMSIQACPSQSKETGLILSANTSILHKHIYASTRFATITTILLEHDMPSSSGLDFCMHLQRPDLHLILLTKKLMVGEVMSAFNEGLIHHYISKSDDNVFEKTLQAIADQQWDYFIRKTDENLYDIGPARKLYKCFCDAAFCNFFQKLCKENDIIEYYLINFEGDFLLCNRNGELSLLIIKSEETMQNHQFYAEQHRIKNSMKNFHEKIKQRSHVLFMQEKVPLAEMEHYLHPADKVRIGEDNFYYNIVKNLNSFGFNSHDIISFNAYLEKQPAVYLTA